MIKHQCITDELHDHKYNLLYIYDKITDTVLHVHELLPISENPMRFISIDSSEFDKLVNDSKLNLIGRVTNQDSNNLEGILVCDIFTDYEDRYSEDYCMVNGILTKRYDIVLTTTAIDIDGDGIKDIEGDGISEASFMIKIVDIDTRELISDYSGLVEAKSDRGKIIGDNGRFINIVNGQGLFILRSVPETVSGNKVRTRLMFNSKLPSDRAHMSELFKINFI